MTLYNCNFRYTELFYFLATVVGDIAGYTGLKLKGFAKQTRSKYVRKLAKQNKTKGGGGSRNLMMDSSRSRLRTNAKGLFFMNEIFDDKVRFGNNFDMLLLPLQSGTAKKPIYVDFDPYKVTRENMNAKQEVSCVLQKGKRFYLHKR